MFIFHNDSSIEEIFKTVCAHTIESKYHGKSGGPRKGDEKGEPMRLSLSSRYSAGNGRRNDPQKRRKPGEA
jgi:hypothetical protein